MNNFVECDYEVLNQYILILRRKRQEHEKKKADFYNLDFHHVLPHPSESRKDETKKRFEWEVIDKKKVNIESEEASEVIHL